MFRGLTSVNIDAKGRITIPTAYRSIITEECGSELVVTIDTEARCLLLYPRLEWLDIEEKLGALPSFNPAARRIQRLLIGHATDLELDNAGRVLLPTLLREYAGLDKSVMLVGQGKKFEIWGESQWQEGREGWLSNDGEDELPPELQTLSL